MSDIGIGQVVLINGTNAKRKAAEGIPINAKGVVCSISHAPDRPTIYNVEMASGHKHGLYLKEFKIVGISMAEFVSGMSDDKTVTVEGAFGDEGETGLTEPQEEGAQETGGTEPTDEGNGETGDQSIS